MQAMLERTYDVSGEYLAGQLTEVAGKLAEEYWTEHQQDFFYIVDGSFLEEYDEYNIGVQFKAAATVSITYALMSRCGLEPERYFDYEDFMALFDFNTPSTIGALGTAVSQINQQVLRQIGVTVRLSLIHILMNAPDVTEVVNACDAGREGERIFRSVYELAGCQKPMKRLWISSMEDSAIREVPALAQVPSDLLAIAVVTVNGDILTAGSADTRCV